MTFPFLYTPSQLPQGGELLALRQGGNITLPLPSQLQPAPPPITATITPSQLTITLPLSPLQLPQVVELLAPLLAAVESHPIPHYYPPPSPSQLPQVVELLAPLLSAVDSQPVLLEPLASRGEAGDGGQGDWGEGETRSLCSWSQSPAGVRQGGG